LGLQHDGKRVVQAQTLRDALRERRSHVGILLGDFVETVYFPHLESKRKPSTIRGYKQMWKRYLKPRCASLIMHDVETRTVQALLDTISREDRIGPQPQGHIQHLLNGMFRFAIAQGHSPRGTVNPVTFTETEAIPDFDGRSYSLEIALMLQVLPEPSRTAAALAAFTGLRAGEIRGLSWGAYTRRNLGDDGSLGVIRVLRSVWRRRIGEQIPWRSSRVR
jgi:hypothetical protein